MSFKISSNEARRENNNMAPKNMIAKSHFFSHAVIFLLLNFICILSQNFKELSRTFLSFAQNIYKRCDKVKPTEILIVKVYGMPVRRGSYHFFFQKRHLIKVR